MTISSHNECNSYGCIIDDYLWTEKSTFSSRGDSYRLSGRYVSLGTIPVSIPDAYLIGIDYKRGGIESNGLYINYALFNMEHLSSKIQNMSEYDRMYLGPFFISNSYLDGSFMNGSAYLFRSDNRLFFVLFPTTRSPNYWWETGVVQHVLNNGFEIEDEGNLNGYFYLFEGTKKA